MKIIEVDDELYHFIASKTEKIGEDASDILRRLLGFEPLDLEDVVSPTIVSSPEPVNNPEPTERASSPEPVISVVAPCVDVLALDELDEQLHVVGRFLYILNALHQTHSNQFDCILQIKGRDRLYFAKSQEELVGSGSSTNPKEIGQTGYWVLTNSNSTRKKQQLTEVAQLLGYSDSEVVQLIAKLGVVEKPKAAKKEKATDASQSGGES